MNSLEVAMEGIWNNALSIASLGFVARDVAVAASPQQVFYTSLNDIHANRQRSRAKWLAQDIDDETVCILAATLLN